MIILLTLLYAFLSSGGYLDSFGGLGNFTGLFGFQSSDTTTPPPIPLKPAIIKNVPQGHDKASSRKIPIFRYFNDGHHPTRNSIRTNAPFKRTHPARFKTRTRTKSPIPRRLTKAPVSSKSSTTRNLTASTTTTTIKTPAASTTDVVPKNNFTNDVLEVVELNDGNLMQSEVAVDTTTDIPPQSTYVTKYVETCPVEGYFFKKDYQNGSPTICYLCFCKDNGSAVCWPRNNRRCDAESYQHNLAKKRVSRNRRSPLSFGNLFMADAARDALHSSGKRQCKPSEASYSEGCPPDDWCVGCTVCDCGTNGMWDCHLLSFCSEDTKKKNGKPEHTTRPYDPFAVKSRKAERKIAQKAVQKLAEKMAQDRQKKKIGKTNSRRYFFKNGTLVNKTIFDLRKRKKSPTIVDKGAKVMEKWNDVNLKIRKIPDNIQKQMMLDKQNKNAKKVSETANFFVRKMPNQKTKRNMQKLHAQAVSVLAKREPLRRKRMQIILPSGHKLPKEILAKLPNGIIPPSKDFVPEHFPKASHEKQVMTNQKKTTIPPRKEFATNKKTETVPLPSNKSKKVIVKRSTHENVAKSHKQNKSPESSKSARSLRKDKPATKGSKIIKKQFMGLKEKSKNKSARDTNTKINNKNSLKNTKTNAKRNTKAYKNNKISYRNDRSKRANITKRLNKNNNPNKRSLSNNYPKSNTNSQKNKIIKRNRASQSSPTKNKPKNKNPAIMVKRKDNKNKKNVNNVNKKDKNIKNNKPLSKLSKRSKSKNMRQTNESIRNKRSNKETWVKTVQEGHTVKKIAPKNEAVKKSTKRNPRMAQKPQIDQNVLNEKVRKMSQEIHAKMNRKILESVMQMIQASNNSKKVKRSAPLNKEITQSVEGIGEKSVDFPTTVQIAPNFISKDKHFGSVIQQNLNWRGTRGEKQRSQSSTEFSGQSKVKTVPFNKLQLKKYSNIDVPVVYVPANKKKLKNNSKIDIPIVYVPPKKQKQIHDSNDTVINTTMHFLTNTKNKLSPSEMIKSSTTTQHSNKKVEKPAQVVKNLSKKIVKAKDGKTDKLYKYISSTKISQNEKDSKPKAVKTKNDKIHKRAYSTLIEKSEKNRKDTKLVPVMKTPQNIINATENDKKVKTPTKKSQKTKEAVETKNNGEGVEISNKVKVQRHKRSVNENLYLVRNISDVENEMTSNTIQDISHTTTRNKLEKQDYSLKYYKYTINDDNLAKSTDNNYLNEIVEVYTKNSAAKRSVDKQVQDSPGIHVLQIRPSHSNNKTIMFVQRNHNKSKTILPNKNETVIENDNLKAHAADINIHNPTNILDDRVVIIHNVSSVEHLNKFITLMPTSTIKNDLETNSVNITVIGVEKQESTLNEKFSNATSTTTPKKAIEVNNEPMVDRTGKMINNQRNSTSKIPTSSVHLSITTEYYQASPISTDLTKTPLLLVTTEKVKTIEKQKTSNNISKPFLERNNILKVTVNPLFTNIAENSSQKIFTAYSNEDKIDENIVIIRENEFRPQQNLNVLNYDHSTNVIELTTENYKKSQYKLDKNITKPLSSENEIKETETSTPKTTTEKIKHKFNGTTKTSTEDYLKYQLDKKSFKFAQKSATLKKLRKNKKAQSKQKDLNNTETKYEINNNVFKVLQKYPHTKTQRNSTLRRNTTVLNPQNKMYVSLNKTSFLNNKIGNSTLIHKTAKILNNEEVFASNNKNYTEINSTKNIIKSNEIKKVNLKNVKKHKLKKILTTLYNRKKDQRQSVENNLNKKNANKTHDLSSFFKKLISGFKFNKHSRKQTKKRFQILKYLQKFFKQIFNNYETNKNNKSLTAKADRKNILDTLCKSFGPCDINIKNKAKLQSQLDHLNSETYKMLRSVKIIKGLLKLIDNTRNDKNVTAKSMFKSDVQKLHEILRDKYSNENRLKNLTETQKIQIQYIKKNIQNFIQAAAKFTMVLNEIINVITVPDNKKVKNRTEISDVRDSGKIFKMRDMNKTVAPTESHESLLKLKELISKYSLIQNTFMRRIYNILNDFASTESAQNKNKISSQTPALSNDVQNKTEEIQVYTKNIIQNLRKLKNLAQTLNGNMRRKRELRDEDSFEYLLMLMEYLLKQKKPLDSTPVNDGIDLLLEAIKNAPDIKLIQKKVLPIYNISKIPIQQPSYRAKPTVVSTEVNRSKESLESDSVSDSKPSKEESITSKEENVTSKEESVISKENKVTSISSAEPKHNTVNNFFDDDPEEEDYYTFHRRAQLPTTVEVKTSTEKQLITRVFESVTESNYNVNHKEVKANTKPKSFAENSNEDLFNRFVEDEVATHTTEFDVTSSSPTETSSNREIVTTTIVSTPKTSRSNKIEEDISASKSRLDWLDETYEEEIKPDSRKFSSTTEKTDKSAMPTEKSDKSKQPIKSPNVSRFSKVENDELAKTTTKEITYKKELDLLNSLDYGTGKVDAADLSLSRESGTIDKYSGDAFAAYVS